MRIIFQLLATLVYCSVAFSIESAPAEEITHRFLACGSHTYLVDDAGKTTWTYPSATRDGYVLTDGTILLTVNKSGKYPGGAVVEVKREGARRHRSGKGRRAKSTALSRLPTGRLC